MKKIILGLVLILALGSIVPETHAGGFLDGVNDMIGASGAVPDGEFLLPCPEAFNEIGQYVSARTYIINVLNFILSFLGIIAMIFVIYAGFLYVTAGGDDGQHEKAKKIVMYAAAGILVVLVSFALVNTLIRSAVVGDPDRGGTQGGATYSGEGGIAPPSCRQLDGGESTEKVAIDVTGEGVKSFGQGVMVSLEGARNLYFKSHGVNTTNTKEFAWSFGDGTTETDESNIGGIGHSYGEAGVYRVDFLLVRTRDLAKDQYFSGSILVIVDGVRADFTASNFTPMVKEDVALDGRASKSAVGSITKYEWECSALPTGGGCTFPSGQTGAERGLQFTKEGTYTVKLTTTNNIEVMGSTEREFNVLGDAPTAVIDSVTQTGRDRHPAEYLFDGAGSMNIVGTPVGLQYVWDFGDGNPVQTVSSQTVTHEYEIAGEKTVKLNVRYSHNGTWLESENVESPISGVITLWADFTVPTFLTVGQEFSFQAQGTEGSTYTWTFPDEATTLDPLDFPTVRAFFTTAGSFDIQLFATKGPETTTITKTVFVREEGEPMAVIQSSDGTDWTNVSAILDATRNGNGVTELLLRSNSVDEAGDVGCSDAQLSYSWSVSGTPVSTECNPSDSVNPLLTEAHAYPITLTVYRPGNTSIQDMTSFTVEVGNVLPTIDSLVYDTNTNPDPIPEGPVNFSITATASDPDTNTPITEYKFEAIENGQVQDVQILSTGEAYFDLSQYAGVHTFSFRVTATDADNGSTVDIGTGTYTFHNEIVNTPPVITGFSADKTGVAVGESVRFDATAIDGEGDTLTYEWSITKGGQPAVLHNTGTEPFYIHTFSEVGVYEAHVRVSDGVNPPVTSNNVITINVVP